MKTLGMAAGVLAAALTLHAGAQTAELVGAIGVSGAPSGEIDERCARRGYEAISEDLELGG